MDQRPKTDPRGEIQSILGGRPELPCKPPAKIPIVPQGQGILAGLGAHPVFPRHPPGVAKPGDGSEFHPRLRDDIMDPSVWVRKWSSISAQPTQLWKQTPWGHSQIAKNPNNPGGGALEKMGLRQRFHLWPRRAPTTKLSVSPRGEIQAHKGKGQCTHLLLPAFKSVG